jgi:DNA-directed RNA polymerase specialized sigma24 family protein
VDLVPRVRTRDKVGVRNKRIPHRKELSAQIQIEDVVGADIRAWLFTIMHNQHVNDIRRAVREEATVDVNQLASALVATTDPTASRQLSELDRALGHL